MPLRTLSIFSSFADDARRCNRHMLRRYADRFGECAAHFVSVGFALLACAGIRVAAVDDKGAQLRRLRRCSPASLESAPPETRSSCTRPLPPPAHRTRSRPDHGASFFSSRNASRRFKALRRRDRAVRHDRIGCC